MVPILFLAFFVASRQGQPNINEQFNGYWWKSVTPQFKLGWVSGYAMAMDSAGGTAIASCVAELPMYEKQWPNLEAKVILQKMCLSQKQFDYDGVSMGQFVDGINAFYDDYRNTQLDVGWAIQYVRDAVKGKSAKELDAELSAWRSCSAASQSGDKEAISKTCAPPTNSQE